MSVTAATLRELHRLHQQLAELHDRLERGPKQIRAGAAHVDGLKAQLEEKRERAQQTQMTIDRKQLDLKAGEQKIVDLKQKLNAAASNKEYQALREQIEAAEMAGSVLADEILEAMEKLDTLSAAVAEAERTVQTATEELEKTKRSFEESAAAVQQEISDLEERLAAAESTLPSDFKPDYERVIRNKGAEGLAAVEDGVCGSCGQQITLNMQNELMLSRPVFCKACGCLLYAAE